MSEKFPPPFDDFNRPILVDILKVLNEDNFADKLLGHFDTLYEIYYRGMLHGAKGAIDRLAEVPDYKEISWDKALPLLEAQRYLFGMSVAELARRLGMVDEHGNLIHTKYNKTRYKI